MRIHVVSDVHGSVDALGRAAEGADVLVCLGDLVLFGHVHQPLQQRIRIGRSECVNVGHFRGTGSPYVVEYGR